MNNRSYINGHQGHAHYVADRKFRSLQLELRVFGRQQDHTLILKELSDPTKRAIYFLLHNVDELPVMDICQILGVSQSAASHALSDLKKLGLVASNRCGKLVCYSLKAQQKSRRSLLSHIEAFLA